MKVFVVGLNHRTAPLEVREQVAFTKASLPEALQSLGASFGQGVILSTCNRTEIYGVASNAKAPQDRVTPFLAGHGALPVEKLRPYIYVHYDLEAVQHLFRVASGLDSMILGESQVLGQVRGAFSTAAQEVAVSGPLSRLFHQALRVGKRARRETGVGKNPLSVSHACVALAKRALGDISRCRVMVVGVGEAGKLAARALRNAGSREILVTNRTMVRAEELAQELQASALPFSEMEQALEEVDIVITATGSPGYVISFGVLREAMIKRNGRPLFIIDIAIPRDVDPRVSELEGLHLYDIDDLENVSEAHRLENQREAEKVETIVGEEARRFMDWWRSLEVLPVLAALRQRGEDIRRREAERTLKALTQLSPQERAKVEALSKAIVKRLLHDPTLTLKKERDATSLQVVQKLFRLEEES